MRSTFSGLNTMVRGIYAQQISMDTLGHNITNAGTQGYSRQLVNLTTMRPQTVPGVFGDLRVGTGVDIDSVTRARDTFADKQFWKENASLKNAESQQYTLSKLESVFQEPTETGLQTVMSKFYNGWHTLSTNAGEYSNRVVVRDSGKELVNAFSHIKTQMFDLINDNNTQVALKTDTINQITSELLSLNKQIVTLECGMNGNANDLRDRRDLLVDQLSEEMKVNVTELSDGSYSITCGGTTIVDGNGRLELAVQTTTDSNYQVPINRIVEKTTGIAIDIRDGAIRGVYDSVETIKDYLDQMATMTAFLLKDFNDVHKAGHGLNDETGINFFDGQGIEVNGVMLHDYSSLQYDTSKGKWMIDDGTGTMVEIKHVDLLNALKVNSEFDKTGGTDKIAAKTKPKTPIVPGDDQEVASGDNAALLADLLQVTSSATLGNKTLTGYYSGMIGALGISAQEAGRNVTNQETILAQIDGWRQSVAGVNWDEELSNMIKFNKGYSACSRCLTTMDEMLDKLINSTGLVGR